MSGLLGPDGTPMAPARRIPDQVIAQVMSDHEARLNALAAQQVHLAIMLEYTTNLLVEVVPDFVLVDEDFAEFRDKRFEEMKAEAMDLQEARRPAQQAAATIKAGGTPVDLDLDEVDDFGGEDLDG